MRDATSGSKPSWTILGSPSRWLCCKWHMCYPCVPSGQHVICEFHAVHFCACTMFKSMAVSGIEADSGVSNVPW